MIQIRTITLWLVLMPIIIFTDIICFILGIFSKEVRRLYIHKFYNGDDSIFKECENE